MPWTASGDGRNGVLVFIDGQDLVAMNPSGAVLHRAPAPVPVPADIRGIAALINQPTYVVSEHRLGPYEYHRRIDRPGTGPRRRLPDDESALVSTSRRLSLLERELDAALTFLEPTTANRDAYGHQLRRLLIVAATEVEAAFKAMLRVNGYNMPANWNLDRDYSRLIPIFGPTQWAVRLKRHAGYGDVRPFAQWAGQGTSPAFWAAYNATKHDAEANLHRATLSATIDAVAAAFVVAVVQFGFDPFEQHRSDHYVGTFEIVDVPIQRIDQNYFGEGGYPDRWNPVPVQW